MNINTDLNFFGPHIQQLNLAGWQVQVSPKFDESEDSNELAALETGVAALANLARSMPGPSNLTAAILNAVATFEAAPTDNLKVTIRSLLQNEYSKC